MNTKNVKYSTNGITLSYTSYLLISSIECLSSYPFYNSTSQYCQD